MNKIIPDAEAKETATAQLWRMQEIVDYQLQRAAVSGKQTFNKPVEISPVADQIINALDKVYIDKQIATQTDIDPDLKFYGEKGDLMEVLGNIFDNAYTSGPNQESKFQLVPIKKPINAVRLFK